MIRRNKISFELEIIDLLSFYLCARSVLKKILIHALCRVINEKTKHTHEKTKHIFLDDHQYFFRFHEKKLTTTAITQFLGNLHIQDTS